MKTKLSLVTSTLMLVAGVGGAQQNAPALTDGLMPAPTNRKENNVPHGWHGDDPSHDLQHWRMLDSTSLIEGAKRR